MPLTD